MTPRTRSAVVAVVVALLVVATYLIQGQGGSSGDSTDQPTARQTTSAPVAASASAGGSADVDPDSSLPYVDVADLPSQAREVLVAIERGGPFDHPDKDGSTFGNFEGLLPPEPRGYYAEYTVRTPGESDRGPRRVIAGDGGELYWTADHYESFSRIRT